ncbi:hypothetical protein JCM6882_007575 [Rhodosporidiobolus microsporus]
MVHRLVPLLALAAFAAAATPDFAALEALVKRQAVGLAKRQSSSDSLDQVQGLLDLAQLVVADAQSGNLSTDCTNWASGLSGCRGDSSDDYQIAVCACSSDILDDMTSCASGYGSDGEADAQGFNTFCSTTLPSLPDNSTISSAFSSVIPSATSAISEVSSAASSASSTSSAASQSASSPAASATGGGNGASKIVGAGGVAGLLAAVAALAL